MHQVTNTIRIANTGWRIRICIREYSDSLIHSRILLTECASEEEVLFGKYIQGYIIHNKTETPKVVYLENSLRYTCNVLLAWEPPFKKI